ncbi:hypothetical protein [Burkholderia sp. IMCC1007]|uniref:hypothetical protein n=1 Tax=Burkholderia sp. IMCC1007 TaxID=3004104 RepID=UPI0022B46852|nr:hypothetical protein [Burkholderia sp. IMCC1007]
MRRIIACGGEGVLNEIAAVFVAVRVCQLARRSVFLHGAQRLSASTALPRHDNGPRRHNRNASRSEARHPACVNLPGVIPN